MSSERLANSARATRPVRWVVLGFTALLASCGSDPTGPCRDTSLPWSTSVVAPAVGSAAVVNVKDFNAVGDGSTDDSAAFANALSALAAKNGGTLQIPPGTYLVGDVAIGSGIFITGVGSPLPVLVKSPAAASILNIVSAPGTVFPGLLHDIRIEQLTLRGRSVQDGFSEHTHNLLVIGVSRLSLRNVTFEAFQGDGLYLGTRLQPANPVAHNSDVNVTDSVFDGVNDENRNGVSVIDCDHCTIVHNTFLRTTRFNMPGAIDLEPNQRDEILHDVAVTNNFISGSNGNTGAISVGLGFKDFLESPAHLLINNNQIDSSKNGISVVWRGGQATSQVSRLDLLIWENAVNNVERALVLDGVRDVTAEHNNFSESRLDIVIGCTLGAIDVHFLNNSFVRLGSLAQQGITLCGPVSFIDFEGNTFSDLGMAGGNGSALNFAGGSATSINFTANVFSSPTHATRLAVSATNTVVFMPETNTWNQNTLHDGIQVGTFPHGAGVAAGCGQN